MKRKLSNPECDSFGHKYWYNESGEYHRDNDLPAIERSDSKYWYKNNKIHRDNNLPAIEYANGTKFWYDENGVMFRWDEWINKSL